MYRFVLVIGKLNSFYFLSLHVVFLTTKSYGRATIVFVTRN